MLRTIQTFISDKVKEIIDLKVMIKSLKRELEFLRKQKFFVLNHKSFDSLQKDSQTIFLKEIQENISENFAPTLENYGLKLSLITFKSPDLQHIINFEDESTRRNIGNFKINKFVSINKMNGIQKDEAKQNLFEIQKNFVCQCLSKLINI